MTRSLVNIRNSLETLLMLLCIMIEKSMSDECSQVSSCSCVGRSYVLSLSMLASDDSKPRFNDVKSTHTLNDTYSYNPCNSFAQGTDTSPGMCGQPDGVAVCKFNGTHYTSLGTQASAKFEYNVSMSQHQINYKDDNSHQMTFMLLMCAFSSPEKSELTVTQVDLLEDNTTVHFYMTLKTPCACPNGCLMVEDDDKGLSFGSLLLILLCIFISAYLGGGMLYMYHVRGARGWEIIPHYEFWLDFPLLVKDGFVFVTTGCKTTSNYDRI